MSSLFEESYAFLNLNITQKLFHAHPNSFAVHPTPDIPLPAVHWLTLLVDNPELLDPLRSFLTTARRLQLPRSPISLDVLPLLSERGMSPKKAHEVSRMATYVLRLIRENRIPEHTLRIVDIGAGQGYLTRALKSHLKQAHILAIDADKQQTRGAQKWEERLLPTASPPISHATTLISSQTLLDTIDLWVESEPVPVLFVALHACGSLTPDILRAYNSASHSSSSRTWYPVGLVVVGCCYNLMNPVDFPLSKKHLDHSIPLHLPASAYHLAAQIPDQWIIPDSIPPTPHPSVSLAIRKVAWRALLEKALQNATPSPDIPSPSAEEERRSANQSATVPARWLRLPEISEEDVPPSTGLGAEHGTSGVGMIPLLPRLGKLRDAAYTNWNTFLHIAEGRMRVKFSTAEFDPEETECSHQDHLPDHESNARKTERETLEHTLEVLHVLRCLVGPVVESTILRDRVEWVREELGSVSVPGTNLKSNEPCVELVNLFDQATGSGRNVAIVIAKRLPHHLATSIKTNQRPSLS